MQTSSQISHSYKISLLNPGTLTRIYPLSSQGVAIYYIFFNNSIISSELVSKVPNLLTLSTLIMNSFSLRTGVTLVSFLSS